MGKFVELSKEKKGVINSVLAGSPSFVDGHLSFFPAGSEILFDNQNLSKKVVQAGIWASGALIVGSPVPVYKYELVRIDGNMFDVDRYPLSLSGSVMLKGNLDKNFPEHHSLGIPHWYN